MEKIWLKSYPRAYRTTSTPEQYHLGPPAGRSFRKPTQSPFSGSARDRWMNYGELTAVGRAGHTAKAWACSPVRDNGHHAAR